MNDTTASEMPQRPLSLDAFLAFLAERFADREQPSPDEALQVLAELCAAGVQEVGALDAYLNAALPLAIEYEAEFPPEEDDETDIGEGDEKFAALGIVRIAMQIALPHFLPTGEDTSDSRIEELRERLAAGVLRA